MTSENEFCRNLMSQDTITPVYSDVYDFIGGHKHSLDQDSQPKAELHSLQDYGAVIGDVQ